MEPSLAPARRKRVLLGQLISNGDCLFATTVARQIKTDDPDCHLTWAISSRCRQVLRGNPHVDEVWEFVLDQRGDLGDHWPQVWKLWDDLRRESAARLAHGDFDEVHLTQFDPGRAERYDGTVRSIILSGYPRPITVPLAPVLRLEPEEIANVRRFAEAHPAVGRCTHVLLFECSPKSGQSFVTPAYALEVSRALVARRADVCVLLSSNLPIATGHERIIDASALAFRENAEITKHCTLLVGCSSGITWLASSDWAKPLPTVQLLARISHLPNSLARDHERLGLPTDAILEMLDCPPSRLVDCLGMVMDEGFAPARRHFHERISLATTYKYILRLLLASKRYRAAWRFYLNNLRRDWPERGLLLLPLWNTFSFFADPLKPFWRRCAAAITPRPRARP